MPYPRPRELLVGLVVLAVTLASPVVAQAQKNLQVELKEMAKKIQVVLRGRSEEVVALMPFRCTNDVPASSGPGICEQMRLELHQVGIRVETSARLKIKGTYEGAIEEKTSRLMLSLKVQVVDERDVTIINLNRSAYGEEVVLSALAPTLMLPLDADEKGREDAVIKVFDKATVHITDNRVKPAAECPYGVEVWVKEGREYRPRMPRDEKGLAYVPLKRDDIYAVRLVNDSDHEAAVTLAIDGLHTLSFSEIKERNTGRPVLMPFLIPPKKAVLIKGWVINLKRSDEFLVTGYAQSAVKELNSDPDKVGTISVSFAAAWPKSSRPPADEPKGKSGDFTGRGAPVETPFQSEERKIGITRAVVSIRYTR